MLECKPASTSINSDCPLPATPATPSTSPRCSVKLTSRSAGNPRADFAFRFATSSSGVSRTGETRLRSKLTLRPTISSARPSFVAPSAGRLPTTRPRRKTVIVSQMLSTSSNLCEMKIRLLPAPRKPRITPNSDSASCGVSTLVGSSRISTVAPRSSARKISTRCFSPGDSSDTRALGSTCNPYSSANALICGSSFCAGISAAPTPSARFSATLCRPTSTGCCGTSPIPIFSANAGEPICTAFPAKRISPSSGRYKPYKMLINVDLPAPFSPSSARISPRRNSRFTPSLAITPGKRFVMPSSSSRGGSAVKCRSSRSATWSCATIYPASAAVTRDSRCHSP